MERQDIRAQVLNDSSLQLVSKDLVSCIITGATLIDCNLLHCTLIEAHSFGCTLTECTVSKSEITRGNIGKTKINDSTLTEGTVRKSGITRGDIRKVRIYNSDVRNCKLEEAALEACKVIPMENFFEGMQNKLSFCMVSNSMLTSVLLTKCLMEDNNHFGGMACNRAEGTKFSDKTTSDYWVELDDCSPHWPGPKHSCHFGNIRHQAGCPRAATNAAEPTTMRTLLQPLSPRRLLALPARHPVPNISGNSRSLAPAAGHPALRAPVLADGRAILNRPAPSLSAGTSTGPPAMNGPTFANARTNFNPSASSHLVATQNVVLQNHLPGPSHRVNSPVEDV